MINAKRKLSLVLALAMLMALIPALAAPAAAADPWSAPLEMGRYYFISSSEGSDSNDGLTPATAWKTVQKLNTVTKAGGLNPGDHVMFKAGDTWRAQLWVQNCFGTEENPIVFDFYGPLALQGNITDYPRIDAMGGFGLGDDGQPLGTNNHYWQGESGAAMLVNVANFEMRHLQITNDNDFVFANNTGTNIDQFIERVGLPEDVADQYAVRSTQTGTGPGHDGPAQAGILFHTARRAAANTRNGVVMLLSTDKLPQEWSDEQLNSYLMKNVYIEDNYLHDIDGITMWGNFYSKSMFEGAMIAYIVGTLRPNVTMENVYMERNTFRRVGTMQYATYVFTDDAGAVRFSDNSGNFMRNMVFRDNYADEILGGIIDLCCVDGAITENNTTDNWGMYYKRECAGMYSWRASNVTYARNVIANGPGAGRVLSPTGGADGGAWDYDSGLHNVIHEYNYTYNNPMGTFNWLGRNHGNILRYNIAHDKRSFFINGAYGQDYGPTYIVNNIVYFDSTTFRDSTRTAPNRSQGGYEECYRIWDTNNWFANNNNTTYKNYMINNLFYDYGNGRDGSHWLFQGITGVSGYRSSAWFNNYFYFANGNTTHRSTETVESVGPWAITDNLDFQNNLVGYGEAGDPKLAGVSGTGSIKSPWYDAAYPAFPADSRQRVNNLMIDPETGALDPWFNNWKIGSEASPLIGKGLSFNTPIREYNIPAGAPSAAGGTTGAPGTLDKVDDPTVPGGFTRDMMAGYIYALSGVKDFFGNEGFANNTPDIGIHQWSVENAKPEDSITQPALILPGDGNLALWKKCTSQYTSSRAYTLTDGIAFSAGRTWAPSTQSNMWNTGDAKPQWIEIDFGEPTTFNNVRLLEWTSTHPGNDRTTAYTDWRPKIVYYTYSMWDEASQSWVPFYEVAPNLNRAGTATNSVSSETNAAMAAVMNNYLNDVFEPVTTSKLRIDLKELIDTAYIGQIMVFNKEDPGAPNQESSAAFAGEITSDTFEGDYGTIELTLAEAQTFNRISLKEKTNLVTAYSFDVLIGDEWVKVGGGSGLKGVVSHFFDDLIPDGATADVRKSASKIRLIYNAIEKPVFEHFNTYLVAGYVTQKKQAVTLERKWDFEDTATWSLQDNISSGIPNVAGNGVDAPLTPGFLEWGEDAELGRYAHFGYAQLGTEGNTQVWTTAGTNKSYLSLANDAFPAAMYDSYSIEMWVSLDDVYRAPNAPTNGKRDMMLYMKGATRASSSFSSTTFYAGSSGAFWNTNNVYNTAETPAGRQETIEDKGSAEAQKYMKGNRWNHVVMTWDGWYHRVYIDGYLAVNQRIYNPYTDEAKGLVPNTSDMLFGNSATNEAYPDDITNMHRNDAFFGKIAEISLYSGAMTQAEVKALYEEEIIAHVKVTSVAINSKAKTLVEDCAANIPVTVQLSEATDEPVYVALYDAQGVMVSEPVDASSGSAVIKIGTNAIKAGAYKVGGYVGDRAPSAFDSLVVVGMPASIWEPSLTLFEGYAIANFTADISFNVAKAKVTLNGAATASYQILEDGKSLRVDGVFAETGNTVVVTGLKYPILFPSYSFTFTLIK